MRERARAVVIGGGVGGCSVLYHLAKLGWTDSVLVEQYGLTHGSTWHSAGLVGQLRSSVSLTRMMMYSVGLYGELERETGKDPGWHQLGGLRLASSQARLEEIRRQNAWARTFGLPMEIISAAEAQEKFPLMSTDGVLAAAYLPYDGYLDPSQLTFALADAARLLGAELETRTKVLAIEQRDGRVCAVVTDKGRIECEVVVNAAGMYAPEVGRLVGVAHPDHPVRPPVRRHRAGRSGPAAAAHAARPRQPRLLPHRGRRPRDGRLRAQPRLVGAGRHPGGLRGAAAVRGLGPDGGADDERDPPRPGPRDAADQEASSTARRRSRPTPSSSSASREVPGFWVAAGFCAHGLAGAGGIGKTMAEWIVDGQPEWEVWALDIRRFGATYGSQRYTLARTYEALSKYYDIKYPGEEREGRPAAAGLARLRPPRRARCRLRREVRLGARELVRVQRRRRRRVAAAARLGGPELVARHRRRSGCHPHAAGPVRRDQLREDRGRRPRRARPAAAAVRERRLAGRSGASPTRRC